MHQGLVCGGPFTLWLQRNSVKVVGSVVHRYADKEVFEESVATR